MSHKLLIMPNLSYFTKAVFMSKCFPHTSLILFLFQPKVVTDTEDMELAKQLENLEKLNAEVDGDDDTEEQIGMVAED